MVTPPEPLGSGYVEYSEVLVSLQGLNADTEYCAELVAINEAGTSYGGLRHFTTPSFVSAPVVSTDGARATGPTTARVSGSADPDGAETSLHVDYASANNPWCTSGRHEGTPLETAPEPLGSGDIRYSEILVSISGLSAETEYCAAFVANNEAGTTYALQRRFTTPPLSPTTALITGGGPPPVAPSPTPSVGQPPGGPSSTGKSRQLAKARKVCRHLRKRQRASCIGRRRNSHGIGAGRKKSAKAAPRRKR